MHDFYQVSDKNLVTSKCTFRAFLKTSIHMLFYLKYNFISNPHVAKGILKKSYVHIRSKECFKEGSKNIVITQYTLKNFIYKNKDGISTRIFSQVIYLHFLFLFTTNTSSETLQVNIKKHLVNKIYFQCFCIVNYFLGFVLLKVFERISFSITKYKFLLFWYEGSSFNEKKYPQLKIFILWNNLFRERK